MWIPPGIGGRPTCRSSSPPAAGRSRAGPCRYHERLADDAPDFMRGSRIETDPGKSSAYADEYGAASARAGRCPPLRTRSRRRSAAELRIARPDRGLAAARLADQPNHSPCAIDNLHRRRPERDAFPYSRSVRAGEGDGRIRRASTTTGAQRSGGPSGSGVMPRPGFPQIGGSHAHGRWRTDSGAGSASPAAAPDSGAARDRRQPPGRGPALPPRMCRTDRRCKDVLAGKTVADGALLDNAAGVHHRHPIGDLATTPRSWVMNRMLMLVSPCNRAAGPDLRLDRHVQRRGRFVGDQQRGLQARPSRSSPVAACRRTSGADTRHTQFRRGNADPAQHHDRPHAAPAALPTPDAG